MSRQTSIDVLRAMAIAIMVTVHFIENLSGLYGDGERMILGVDYGWWLPTGFAAPTFALLSGMSYRLWSVVQKEKGYTDEMISKRTIRRGLFLIGLGFMFNVLVWLPEDVFNWDILTLIGFALLALSVVRQMPEKIVILSAGLVIAISPILRVMADYPAFWQAYYFDYDFTISDVLLGWLVVGYFPVFPWLALPMIGYVLARFLFVESRKIQKIQICGFAVISIVISYALMMAWSLMPICITGGSSRGWSMFPPSIPYLLGTLGTSIVVLMVVQRVLNKDAERWKMYIQYISPLSRYSLSIYLLHHIVHLWPLWLYGKTVLGDTTGLWQVAMPPVFSLAFAVGFLFLITVLFHWVYQHQIPTIETFMRWVCD